MSEVNKQILSPERSVASALVSTRSALFKMQEGVKIIFDSTNSASNRGFIYYQPEGEVNPIVVDYRRNSGNGRDVIVTQDENGLLNEVRFSLPWNINALPYSQTRDPIFEHSKNPHEPFSPNPNDVVYNTPNVFEVSLNTNGIRSLLFKMDQTRLVPDILRGDLTPEKATLIRKFAIVAERATRLQIDQGKRRSVISDSRHPIKGEAIQSDLLRSSSRFVESAITEHHYEAEKMEPHDNSLSAVFNLWKEAERLYKNNSTSQLMIARFGFLLAEEIHNRSIEGTLHDLNVSLPDDQEVSTTISMLLADPNQTSMGNINETLYTPVKGTSLYIASTHEDSTNKRFSIVGLLPPHVSRNEY